MDRILIISSIVFLILILLELIFPKRKFSKKVKIKSYITDTIIVISNYLLVTIFSLTSIYYLSKNFFSLNLLSSLNYDNVYVFVLIIVFLDFMIYVWHLLNHKIPLLWMFHKAHHTEIYLNTISGLRFHFVELIFSILFKSFVLIIIFGIPIEIILISEGLIVLFSMFHHTNIKFKGEKLLSKLIIVPYIHQVHHSLDKKNHDTNYGVIFSFWDKMFKTYLNKENKQIGLENIKYQNFIKFITFGFKYKY